jgi:hypothetical protein
MGGGGKSADDYYKEIKPEFGPLPSLSMTKGSTKPVYGNVKRTGQARRSLLVGMTNGS